MARLRTAMDSAFWDLDVAMLESLKAPLRLYQIYRRVTTGSKSEACGVERVSKFRAGNEDRQAEEDHHIGMRIDRDPV
ncbi:hypothetical protein G4B88_021355 [Cannabis sativa]|uniref:Uncharacterized protein n=1 Tax=Cannabis sativa TaxID=3483 RepID=A0A7J6HZB4_CANSA|nr:hypothetical protein G4B88_021355 [Cannabis sativa]